MKLLPLLALLPMFSISTSPVLAQVPAAQCVDIGNDAERLACFDAAFAASTVEANGAAVVLQSEQLVPARPSGREHATITVACEAGVLSVAFAFAGNTLSALGKDAGITWQLDLQAARSRTLPVNADNTAVVLNNTQDAMAFIQSLDGATNLSVRVTPASSRSLNVRYRVSDFATQVAPIVSACAG